MGNEERNDLAEKVGLVRVSSFGHHRSFNLWKYLSREWQEKLAPHVLDKPTNEASE